MELDCGPSELTRMPDVTSLVWFLLNFLFRFVDGIVCSIFALGCLIVFGVELVIVMII